MLTNHSNSDKTLPDTDTNKTKSTPNKYMKTITAVTVILLAAVISIIYSDTFFRALSAINVASDYIDMRLSEFGIYFPDTGNAGCAVAKTQDAVILIDCGRGKAQLDIIDILDSMDIDTIDIAVLTHSDEDHINDFYSVIGSKTIKRFITSEYSQTDKNEYFKQLEAALTDKGISIETAHKGDTYVFGDTTVTIISPDKLYSTSNDNSLVLKIEYGGTTALFTGDISSKAERDILASGEDIRADILQIPHHGSASSSSEEFLRAVSPKTAIIQAQESRYLPSGEVISRLDEIGCEIRRTDIEHGVFINVQ